MQRERLQVLDIASGNQRSIPVDGEPFAISGPNEDGEVALLESTGLLSNDHCIEFVSVRDGKARTVLHREGNIGHWSSLELALRGGRIAFVRRILRDRNPWGPSDDVTAIVVVSSDGAAPIHVVAEEWMETPPRWFPDGRRLSYARSRPQSSSTETWILDVVTGVETSFGEGRIRAMSNDRSIALVAVTRSDENEEDSRVSPEEIAVPDPTPYADQANSKSRTEHRSVDVATGNVLERSVQLGELVEVRSRRVFALLDDHLVLHEGLPPHGWEQRMPDGVKGPGAQYPIRLTDPATSRSAIVLPQTLNWPFAYGPFEFADVAR